MYSPYNILMYHDLFDTLQIDHQINQIKVKPIKYNMTGTVYTTQKLSTTNTGS